MKDYLNKILFKSIIALLQGAQLLARIADNSAESFDKITEYFLQDKLESK